MTQSWFEASFSQELETNKNQLNAAINSQKATEAELATAKQEVAAAQQKESSLAAQLQDTTDQLQQAQEAL